MRDDAVRRTFRLMFTSQLDLSTPGQNMSRIEQLILMFLIKYQTDTRETYRHLLKSWYTWCLQNNLDPLNLHRVHMQLYVEHLKVGHTPSTVVQNIGVVRTFFDVLEADDAVSRNPARHLSLPKVFSHDVHRPYLNRTQFCDLLQYARSRGSRETMIVLLLGVMGLRATEFCNLDISSAADYEHGYRMLRFRGKGGKPTNMPMPMMVVRALEEYQLQYPRHEGPLVTTKFGKRYGRGGLSGMVHAMTTAAGVPPVTAHALRRSMVTNSLNAGADIREVQKAARHSDLITTSRVYDQGVVAHDSSSLNVLAGFISGAM